MDGIYRRIHQRTLMQKMADRLIEHKNSKPVFGTFSQGKPTKINMKMKEEDYGGWSGRFGNVGKTNNS